MKPIFFLQHIIRETFEYFGDKCTGDVNEITYENVYIYHNKHQLLQTWRMIDN